MGVLDKLGYESRPQQSGLIDVSVEEKLIGALILNNEAIYQVYDAIPTFIGEVFTDPNCEKLFSGVYKLADSGMDINISTVSYQSGLEVSFVKKLVEKYVLDVSETAIGFASILFDNYLRRKCSAILQEGLSGIFDAEKEAIGFVGNIGNNLEKVLDGGRIDTERNAEAATRSAMEKILKIREHVLNGNKNTITGVPTGLKAEDKFTGGYQDGNLIIVAARPGMGKSAKVQNTLLQAAKSGFPIGMMTLEMSSDEVFIRLLGIETGIGAEQFKTGIYEKHETELIDRAAAMIAKLPIYIDDKAGMTLGYIKMVASKWKRRYGIKILIIDYLQLISSENKKYGSNRVVEIGEISRGLKSLAKSLKIPIIALSQLSRAVEVRGGSKRPILSDLRESGDLEQDADIVQFIYRPEYYGIMQDETGDPLTGTAELIFAKNRNGRLETLDIGFRGATMTFHDLHFAGQEKEEGYFPTTDPFAAPFTSSPVITRPKEMNDQQDIPF